MYNIHAYIRSYNTGTVTVHIQCNTDCIQYTYAIQTDEYILYSHKACMNNTQYTQVREIAYINTPYTQ